MANSPRQHLVYFKEDFTTATRADARMLARGRIIADNADGDVARLQRQARRWFTRKAPALKRGDREFLKYLLWDALDDLTALYKSGDPQDFSYVRTLALNRTLETYTRYCGAELPAPAKHIRLLRDQSFAVRYGLKKFPDKRFIQLFLSCLDKNDLPSVKKVVAYAIQRMGGLDITRRRLRTPAIK